MGRVRKYKKVKAMDPFAKGGGGGRMGLGRKGGSDMDRNLPPDVKNHQAQRLNNLEGGVCTAVDQHYPYEVSLCVCSARLGRFPRIRCWWRWSCRWSHVQHQQTPATHPTHEDGLGGGTVLLS